jgi:GNAT superfamily N-acetyltransferase
MEQAEIIALADRHTLSVQKWLSSRAPGAEVFQGRGVVASSTGLPVSLLNLALGGGYSPGTPDEAIGEEIERGKSFFARRGVPWYWWAGPTARPPDLAQRLARHGLTGSSPLPAMVARLPARVPQLNPAVRVWWAESLADLQLASTIRRVAFSFREDAAPSYFEDMAPDWLRGDPARLYLASIDGGPPVAIGALIMGLGYPGIYVMATLPEWERRGLGRGILDRMLADAAAEGHELAVLTAGKKGFPLYVKFGFRRVFDYHLAWLEE